jgi:hypothetical protein
VVERERALDGGGGARREARGDALHLQLPVHVQRLLRLRPATRPTFGRALLRPHHPHTGWRASSTGKRVVVIGSSAPR